MYVKQLDIFCLINYCLPYLSSLTVMCRRITDYLMQNVVYIFSHIVKFHITDYIN